MKFLIYLDGSPAAHGHTRFEFKWSQTHGVYLWEGREIEAHEFNKIAAIAFTRYIQFSKLGWVVKAKIVDSPRQEPAATGEVTLDQALEVVEALAPHRLKKKTGPKVEDEALAHA